MSKTSIDDVFDPYKVNGPHGFAATMIYLESVTLTRECDSLGKTSFSKSVN